MQLPRPAESRAEDLRRLADRGNRRSLRPGQVLFHQGSPSSNVAVIESGVIKIEADDESGRTTLINVLGRQTVVGEVGVLAGELRTSRVVSLTPGRVAFVPAGTFVDTLLEIPALSLDLIDQIIARQRDLNGARHDRDSLDIAPRIANHLLRIRKVLEPADRCPLSHEEIATWIGAARPQVSEAVGFLRDCGLISTGRRLIDIVDADGLASLVADAGGSPAHPR